MVNNNEESLDTAYAILLNENARLLRRLSILELASLNQTNNFHAFEAKSFDPFSLNSNVDLAELLGLNCNRILLRLRSKSIGRRLIKAGLLDPNFYMTKYPDVGTRGLSAEYHYVMFGCREGRLPNGHF